MILIQFFTAYSINSKHSLVAFWLYYLQSWHYKHPNIDQEVVTGVAAAGTLVAGGFALGSLLTRILPPLALEKLAPDDDANAVEDLLGLF